MLAIVALSEFLAMTLWFSASATAATIASELRLGAGETAWLTMAVQAGFVCGALLSAVLSLPDVVNPRRLFAVGCVVGAFSNGALTLPTAGTTIIALRFITGASLALVYPPGMKIAAGWFKERRGLALGIVVGALTIGSAFPHLLAWLAVAVPWRMLILVASACAVAGGLLTLVFVCDGPYVATTAPFDFRATSRVFGNRGVRLATLGYFGHMWELYAMWTWIASFAAATLATRDASLVAFIAVGSGAIGCVGAALVADRFGKARIAALAMITSAGCSALAGFAYDGGIGVLTTLAVVWGIAIVADSALFSALLTEHANRDYVGTALTLQMCGGFLLTMASIRLVPVVAEWIGWKWAFLMLVPGPALGSLAMLALHRSERPTHVRL